MSWRTGCIAFAVLSAVLAWRSCARPRPAPTAEACARLADEEDDGGQRGLAGERGGDRGRERGRAAARARPDGDEGAGDGAGDDAGGPPVWLVWLGPQRGEDLGHYRDRVMPVVMQAVAPQRARVARGREAVAAAAGLDARQQAELDAAVTEAAEAIQGRVLEGVLGGDLLPPAARPMAGVRAARDVLDVVDRANQRFLASLREDQRATLARSSFDLADYLLFATRWEETIGYRAE